MHKLLVPIDSSENALRALKHAIGLADQQCEIELLIVTAHERPVVYGEIQVYMTAEKAEQLAQEHSEDILKPAIELAEAAGVPFTTAILVGDVAHEIANAAEKGGCEGIVMGTRGMGTVRSMLLGSVATKVVHLTNLPVTLVK